MSGKKYKQLRREATKHGLDCELVKRVYRRLNTVQRRNLLSKTVIVDKQK